MSATIYSKDGYELATGLQGIDVCDEALRYAREFASERNEDVILDDDDGSWLVHPDGSCDEWEWS